MDLTKRTTCYIILTNTQFKEIQDNILADLDPLTYGIDNVYAQDKYDETVDLILNHVPCTTLREPWPGFEDDIVKVATAILENEKMPEAEKGKW